MRAGRHCPEHGNGYDDCSFIHGQRDRPDHLSGLTMIDPTKVNPDCASRDRPHDPHDLAGPGGNKPGARCGGVPEDPEATPGRC